MGLSKSYIPQDALIFLSKTILSHSDCATVNRWLSTVCGIRNFFDNDAELVALRLILENDLSAEAKKDRREFGDYQTNIELAKRSVELTAKKEKFDLLIEPTCGKGNFIIAALEAIPSINKIVGVEIFLPYVWQTKYNILSYYINNPNRPVAVIDIIHNDVFSYDFEALAKDTENLRTIIVGNPPWVTNSELGTLGSKNLPKKFNLNKQKGLDALTGKSNFDLGEAIMLRLLHSFGSHDGRFGLLIKSTVAKNLVRKQRSNAARIGVLKKYIIDAKKEFNVNVNASLFTGTLGKDTSHSCSVFDFYSQRLETSFGWIKDKFVSSIDTYKNSSHIDGTSKFVWRSGLKHDCSKIMELNKIEGQYRNKLGQTMSLEEDLLYGLLKSSDLKDDSIASCRKYIIVTQRKIGQDTSYIKNRYPNLYKYLVSNKKFFRSRKSSIYKGKPEFSIFGIGDYSFMHHKVAISGLYKKTHFTYVSPVNSKPLMLDDTCYFIGFEHRSYARIAQFLLNSPIVQNFLSSIIFLDSKRSINKDILMRIDIQKVADTYKFRDLHRYDNSITFKDWEEFKEKATHKASSQSTLF